MITSEHLRWLLAGAALMIALEVLACVLVVAWFIWDMRQVGKEQDRDRR